MSDLVEFKPTGDRGEVRISKALLSSMASGTLAVAEEAILAHLRQNPGVEMVRFDDYAANCVVLRWRPIPEGEHDE